MVHQSPQDGVPNKWVHNTPTAPRSEAPKKSAPERNRTSDTGFRRAVLYPLSYWGVLLQCNACGFNATLLRLAHHLNPRETPSTPKSPAPAAR